VILNELRASFDGSAMDYAHQIHSHVKDEYAASQNGMKLG
jgi:hypothetical protein